MFALLLTSVHPGRDPLSNFPEAGFKFKYFPLTTNYVVPIIQQGSSKLHQYTLIFYLLERTLAINPGSLGPVDWISKNNIWGQHNDWS